MKIPTPKTPAPKSISTHVVETIQTLAFAVIAPFSVLLVPLVIIIVLPYSLLLLILKGAEEK